MERIKGIIPAVFTPMKKNGEIDTAQIKPVSDFLIDEKVAAFYVCGSTGEGPLLTTLERQLVTEAYIEAVAGRVNVIVQVGHNSIREAVLLARHAAESGADAISAVPPGYFKLNSLSVLIDCMAEIATAAPDLPFYYYHVPVITGVDFDMLELLRQGQKKIPNLRGIKYTKPTIFEMQACIELENQQFEIFFGTDEMMLSALVAGVKGMVGSTFNFAAPLYNSLIKAYEAKDLDKARSLQYNAVKMVRIFYKYGGQPAIKATMRLIGLDCGHNLLPHKTLDAAQIDSLKNDLQSIGFFNWARKES
ncbi:MAG: dihydrodipicolinate synthase family protein [Deferribacteres bacterium]|nr:dihydrodipicolinate synthase family protein [candidate division KSB1 bacterium]MCB9502389.1 dihydrodipicolinate synthase family protein [Deferribacteres bacterium]